MAKKANQIAVGMARDDARWRAEEDLRTLTRAAEIQADKRRLSAAKQEASRQRSTLDRVAGAPAPRSTKQRLAGKRI